MKSTADKVFDQVFLYTIRIGAAFLAGGVLTLVSLVVSLAAYYISKTMLYYHYTATDSYFEASLPFVLIAGIYLWNKITLD